MAPASPEQESQLAEFSVLAPDGGRSLPVQAKLTIGAPNDPYEQEADRVAAQVVQQINAPQANQPQAVQRDALPEEEALQLKPVVQREGFPKKELQMKSALTAGIVEGDAPPDLEAAIARERGSGQALDPTLQTQMGQAMGADFSGVRVHTDSQSDQLNRSIQAKAFTTGQDVFFRQGAYQPGSQGGQELIAHELTHVMQQNGGATTPQSSLSRSSIFTISRDFVKPVLQRAILPIKTGNAQEDGSIDYGVKFLDEGKTSKQTGKIEANARGQVLNGNAYDELQAITNMQETIYIIGHSDGRSIGGHNPLEIATLLNQNLPPLFQGKIVLISCHTAEHTQTHGFGEDQLRSKAASALTDDDRKKIKAYNMATFKGRNPAPLPADLAPLVTTFAQAVAIKLHQFRAASGITPSSVQGFKGTGSLLAQIGGKDLGVEQSARMLVKTDEARKKIDADYADWENTVYKPAIQALKTRQTYKPKPIKEKSKLKQISNKIGFTSPNLDSPPSCQDQPWLSKVPIEVQQVLNPNQTPSKQDFDAAYLILERASIQYRNNLFIHHGRFGKDAKAVYAVNATGSEIEKAARGRRKAIGEQSKPLQAPSPSFNSEPSQFLISPDSALPQPIKPILEDSTLLEQEKSLKAPIVQGTVLSIKLPSQDEKNDAD